jgi:hypothetical protein
VDRANAARNEFDAADRVHRDLDREVQDLEKKLETDYGPGAYLLNQEPILRLLNLQLQRQRCSRLERF